MNAKLKTFPAAAQSGQPGPARSTHEDPRGDIREGILNLPGELLLHHGTRLRDVRVAWRLTGPASAPVVCALGGISAHRRVCLTENPRESWWPEIAGPGKALDAQRLRVLSFDYLGGCGESSSVWPDEAGLRHGGEAESPSDTAEPPSGAAPPGEAQALPSISSYDQAEMLLRVIDHLGIRSLRAIAGGSYGGMVALAFAERYPDRVARLLIIGASDRAHPMSTAWRSVQRRIVRFALATGRAQEGLALARALAMATYRSAEEFAARFDGAAVFEDSRFVFPVERYLLARGGDYAARYCPESFLCLSESIDLHRVEAARIFVPTTAVAVREDQIVPLGDVRAMVARLPQGRLHEISSVYGHDAFLKESQQLRAIFAGTLECTP